MSQKIIYEANIPRFMADRPDTQDMHNDGMTQYNIQPATHWSVNNPTFLSGAQNTACLVERLKQNLQPHE